MESTYGCGAIHSSTDKIPGVSVSLQCNNKNTRKLLVLYSVTDLILHEGKHTDIYEELAKDVAQPFRPFKLSKIS